MSRRKRQPPAARAPLRRRATLGPWLLVFAAGAFVAFTWWSMRGRSAPPPQSEPAPSAPWGDAARGMGPVEAFAAGTALADSGRSRESLPFLHLAASAAGAPWHAWRAYASALHNVAMKGAAQASAAEAAPRTSVERVALMRLALAHIDRAVALAASREDRAIALLTRAQFLRTWGFPWDALADFHAAGEQDPAWRDQAPFYAGLMRNPGAPAAP